MALLPQASLQRQLLEDLADIDFRPDGEEVGIQQLSTWDDDSLVERIEQLTQGIFGDANKDPLDHDNEAESRSCWDKRYREFQEIIELVEMIDLRIGEIYQKVKEYMLSISVSWRVLSLIRTTIWRL
mgnify:CR=1 FL=1